MATFIYLHLGRDNKKLSTQLSLLLEVRKLPKLTSVTYLKSCLNRGLTTGVYLQHTVLCYRIKKTSKRYVPHVHVVA